LRITHKVSYRDIKYPRVEFTSGELRLILPLNHKAESVLIKHKDWILKKINFINECLKEAQNKKTVKRTENEFKVFVNSSAKEISRDLNVQLNRVYFRRMKSKWASCSNGRNLTINTLMKYLPAHLIQYVIFHEVAHLIEKRHNEHFWKLISRKYKDYSKMERELFVYWFKVNKLTLKPLQYKHSINTTKAE